MSVSIRLSGTRLPRRVVTAGFALALVATLLAFPVRPAEAACGDYPSFTTRDYINGPFHTYYLGASYPKQNTGCYDGNVRYSSVTQEHRGMWKSDSGIWYWSSVGPVWMLAGTQSPVKILIAGPISVGRPLLVGAKVDQSWGIWWF